MFKMKSLYVFIYKGLHTLASAVILLGVAILSGCTPNENTNTFEPQQLENPLTYQQLNVPFITSTNSGGKYSRLTPEEARETINKVFREAGIALEPNYHYKKNELNVKLDGYDAKRKIGYVWIDDDNSGTGMLRPWWGYGYYYGQAKEEIFNTSDFTIQNDIDDVKSHIGTLIENEFNLDLGGNYADEFNKIDDLFDENKKQDAYKELYLDILIQKVQNSHKSGQFPIYKMNKNSSYKEKESAYLDWILREKIKKMTQHIPQKETLNKIIHSILDIEDEALKENRYDDLVNFLQRYHDKYGSADPANDKLLTEDVQQMEKNIHDYSNGYADEKIALREARKLDDLPKIEGDFIAPISRRDLRFSYLRFYNVSYGKISKTQQAENEEANKNAKNEALKNLEAQVRQYIKWAKQQGAY